MASSLSYEIIRGTLMATCTAVPNEFLQFLCWGQAVMFKLLLTIVVLVFSLATLLSPW